MPAITALQAVVGYDDTEVTKGVPRTEGHLRRFASAVGGVGQLAAGVFGGQLLLSGLQSFVGGVGGAITSAGNLQQALANISTIKPQLDTSAVFASLNEISTRVPQSSAQLADALYNIFSSVDVSQAQALSLVETFAKGAVGAQTDAQTFGTAIMGVMNAYKLSVEDAGHVSDVFFNTINAGVVTGPELAASLGPVTQSAKAAGVSLDQLGGMIAGITKEGGPASQNINNLNNFLQKITTTQAQDALRNLGVSATDSTGHFRPVIDILGDLKPKLEGMTEAQRANALQAIFPDAQARQGALTLISQLDFVKQAIENNAKAAGVSAGAYEKMSATFNSQLAILKNTFTAALTTVGAQALPLITPLISAFGKWLPGAFASAIAAIGPFIQQYGPVLVGWLTQGIGILTRWGGAIWGAVSAVVGAFQAFTSGKTTLAEFIGGMEIFAQTILGKLGGLASAALPYIGQFFSMIGGAIATYGPQLLAQMGIWAGYLVDWITGTALPWLLPKLAAFGQALVGWLTGTAIPWLVGAVTGLATALTDWITTTAIPYLQTNLPIWLTALGTWITGTAFPAIVAFITPLAEAFGSWITETAIPYLLENVPQWIAALVGWWYGTVIPTALGFLVKLGQKFGEWVSETAVPYLQDNLPKWLVVLGTWIRETAMPAAVAGLKAVGEKFGTWVTETAVPFLQTNIPKWLSALTDWLTGTALPAIGTKATELGQALVNKFMDEAGKILAKVQTKMGEVPGAIKDGLGDLGSLLVNAGASLIGGLISGITSKIQDLKNVLGGITNSLPDWKGPANKDANLLFGAGQLVISGFIAGMAERIAAVQGMAETVTNAVTRAFGTEATTATATYREHIDDAAVAVNVFREQLTHLLAVMKAIPDRLSTEILTPGLTDAIKSVQDYAAALRAIPTSISTSISTTSGGGGGSSESAAAPNLAWTPGSSQRNTVNVTVTGNTLLGNSPETAADLARILTPELARVVQAGY